MRFTSLAVLGLAAAATAQGTLLPIPAYTSTFSGTAATRGFWFQCPSNIVITGLNVPDESTQGIQNVELLDLGAAPPAYPTTATGTQLFYAANQPSGTPIATNIVVASGTFIGVLGACGTTTMANSYGAAGPFNSTILGQTVALDRLLTQTNINTTGGNQPYSAEPGGSISRVEIYYVPAAGLYPGFSADVTSGASPLTVNFTDSSYSSDPGGILAWVWDVDGDGTPDYNTQNCTHTYAACGNYDVELSVLDATHGLVSLRKNALISVDPITAAFTFSSLGNNAVQFTDTTVGATSWMWDFDGNGTIDSTQQSPQHTYPAGGFYNASLTASNGCNSDTITQSVPTFGLLCTITTGGNGLTAVGSGNYFDINVTNPNGVLITGIEVDAYVATTGNVDVWTVPNSYIGNETNAAAWTNVSSATNQTLSAVGTLDFIDVPDFYLAPGSHGMYIQTAGGVSYTNGNGTNQTFSNGDMTLTLGASSTNFGSPITPRVWNGCIYYDTNPTGVYFAHKPGCAGSAGVTGNVAATGTAPKINTTFIAELSPMPASGVGIMIFSIDDTQWNGLPLPVSLAQFGAPGCFGNVNPESTTLVIGPGGGTGNWNLTIPNVQAFVGTPFFTQALMIDPGVNTLGGVMSDSAKGIVGQ